MQKSSEMRVANTNSDSHPLTPFTSVWLREWRQLRSHELRVLILFMMCIFFFFLMLGTGQIVRCLISLYTPLFFFFCMSDIFLD